MGGMTPPIPWAPRPRITERDIDDVMDRLDEIFGKVQQIEEEVLTRRCSYCGAKLTDLKCASCGAMNKERRQSDANGTQGTGAQKGGRLTQWIAKAMGRRS